MTLFENVIVWIAANVELAEDIPAKTLAKVFIVMRQADDQGKTLMDFLRIYYYDLQDMADEEARFRYEERYLASTEILTEDLQAFFSLETSKPTGDRLH